jgi:preprotein translocase subunit SecG
MSGLLTVILILVCAILSFLVLIQNPKGGGLSGAFGGLGQQMMGVQKSTDTIEKGTWLFAGIMALLCLLSVFVFSPDGTGKKSSRSEEVLKNVKAQAPAAPVTTPPPAAGGGNPSTSTTTPPPSAPPATNPGAPPADPNKK